MPVLTQPAQSKQASHRVRAQLIRKVSGSTDLTGTMRKAVAALARANIPSLVVGVYAAQEHGYARFTSDIDLVGPHETEPAPAQLPAQPSRRTHIPPNLGRS
jgi:hypothetical protein